MIRPSVAQVRKDRKCKLLRRACIGNQCVKAMRKAAIALDSNKFVGTLVRLDTSSISCEVM